MTVTPVVTSILRARVTIRRGCCDNSFMVSDLLNVMIVAPVQSGGHASGRLSLLCLQTSRFASFQAFVKVIYLGNI